MSDAQALGGHGDGADTADGGPGGAGEVLDGGTGLTHQNSGGGGGAVGRIRVNATTPTLEGTLSPSSTTTACTTGPLPLAAE